MDAISKWSVGNDVKPCSNCGRAISYRHGREFCRCEIRLVKDEVADIVVDVILMVAALAVITFGLWVVLP